MPSKTDQIKLEGVAHLGYRTIFVGGIRDPILISQIDDVLERVRKYTQSLAVLRKNANINTNVSIRIYAFMDLYK